MALFPELTLLFIVAFILVAEVLFKSHKPVIKVMFLLGFAIATIYALASAMTGPSFLFSRTILVDPISQILKAFIIFSGMMAVLLSWISREIREQDLTEICVLIALGTFGFCLMTSATHFLLLFLAYEMGSCSCTILCAFQKTGSKAAVSSEAGLKHYVHSSLISVLFAFGIAMLFGISHSFNIFQIREFLSSSQFDHSDLVYLWISFGLILSSVIFRLAAFPFQFVMPDLIEGAPTPISAFLSVGPIMAAVALALRLCIQIFSTKSELGWQPLPGFQWQHLMAAIAAGTMTIGNLAALNQRNLKRLLGHSSVAQLGYILLGIVVSNELGVASLLFSIAAYSIVTLGAFFVIQKAMDRSKTQSLGALHGLAWTDPYAAIVLCIFVLSLTGMPPLLGFASRFYLLGTVMREKIYWLAVVAAINWIIALPYYFSMIRQIFARVRPETQPDLNLGVLSHAALAMLWVPAVVLGFFWDPLMIYIVRSLGTVIW